MTTLDDDSSAAHPVHRHELTADAYERAAQRLDRAADSPSCDTLRKLAYAHGAAAHRWHASQVRASDAAGQRSSGLEPPEAASLRGG